MNKTEMIIRKTTLFTLAFMIAWGLVMVLAQIKPFSVDEWRIIYNLKFKDAAGLMGQLDYMQQFPRVYLQLMHAFGHPFDFSYFTLRMPPYLVGVLAIVLGYRLLDRLYRKEQTNRYLMVMIIVSSYTFTEYFVCTKQYTMDILASIIAVYQLLAILGIYKGEYPSQKKYALLMGSFLMMPFFSYTYPIAIAPVFIVCLLQSVHSIRTDGWTVAKGGTIRTWVLLGACTVGVVVFYIIDVHQLMQDQGMQGYWGHLMNKGGIHWGDVAKNSYNLFAQVGSGLLFSTIFGIMGVAAFIYGVVTLKEGSKAEEPLNYWLRIYAVLVIAITMVLYLLGKLPLGEPRLNAYTVISIAILMIQGLEALRQKQKGVKLATGFAVVLYLGVIGNVYTTFIASVTGPEYQKRLEIYVATENAIIKAQAEGLPILITPTVAYPYDNSQNLPYNENLPGDWVLKTFPAFKVREHLSVYPVANIEAIKELPAGISAAMAGDGTLYRVVGR